MIYDISKISSFENVNRWLQELHDHANADIVVVLCGNKSDLTKARQVTVEAGKELADRHKLPFIETSALDSTNIDLAFEKIINEICARKAPEKPAAVENTVPTDKDDKKSGCCLTS